MYETSWKLSTQFDRLLCTKPVSYLVGKERQAAMCHDLPHFLWLKLETEQFYMLLCAAGMKERFYIKSLLSGSFGPQKEHMIKDEKSEK